MASCRMSPTADREPSQQRRRAGLLSHARRTHACRAAISPIPIPQTSPHVGIINEEFAKRFLPNQNPLGHTIGTDNGRYQMTVVGVVKDHKYRSIDEEPIPMAWYMYAQIPMSAEWTWRCASMASRSRFCPAARKVVQQSIRTCR